VARLVIDPGTDAGGFLGLTVGGRYGSSTTASCEVLSGALAPPRRWGRRPRPAPHDVPDLGCSCGFYAYNAREVATKLLAARPPVSRLFGTALLEVDLGGTVIEFERGFRASQQRVLGVRVPRWCLPCAAACRARHARRLVGLAGRHLAEELQAEMPRHPQVYRLALAIHHTALLERLGTWAAMRPVCDDHAWMAEGVPRAKDGPATIVVCELADLRAHLGTEVSWLDDEEFDVDGYVEALSWTPPGHRRVA
jgi:hypothetical protein